MLISDDRQAGSRLWRASPIPGGRANGVGRNGRQGGEAPRGDALRPGDFAGRCHRRFRFRLSGPRDLMPPFGRALRANAPRQQAMTQEKLPLGERIDAVGAELATLRRCQELGAADADPAGEELAELERSHTELRGRASETIKTLEADLQGLSDAVQRWIARQDRKAAKG